MEKQMKRTIKSVTIQKSENGLLRLLFDFEPYLEELASSYGLVPIEDLDTIKKLFSEDGVQTLESLKGKEIDIEKLFVYG